MISKAQIKLIQSLSQKKFRRANRLFIAEGTKIAEELLTTAWPLHSVYATAAWIAKNRSQLDRGKGYSINEVGEEDLKKISLLSTPPDVFLLAKLPIENVKLPDENEKLVLALESIRDPGNLGTIIRIADWYGLHSIYCSPDCTDAFNPKVVQASMGSIARVRVNYLPLNDMLSQVKLPSYAAIPDGRINVHTLKDIQGALLLIGNESHGLTDEIIMKVTDTLSIPRFGEAESLNAALATGILLDNLVRVINGAL